MSLATISIEAWLGQWADWHAARLSALTAKHGVAALAESAWLTAQPQTLERIPGRWSVQDGVAISHGLGKQLRLPPGARQSFGDRLLVVIAFDQRIGLRVFDPSSPGRVSLVDVVAFTPDPRWEVEGHFERAAAGSAALVDHAGGARTLDSVAGVVQATVAGTRVELVAFPTPTGLQVSFADRTNGITTAQFRFLALPEPAADGSVSVDLNRAYLPPCTFSDHYLCPLPPEQNRLPFHVTAGERYPERNRRQVESLAL